MSIRLKAKDSLFKVKRVPYSLIRYFLKLDDRELNVFVSLKFKLKATTFKANLCDYSDASILDKRKIPVANPAAADANANNANKN